MVRQVRAWTEKMILTWTIKRRVSRKGRNRIIWRSKKKKMIWKSRCSRMKKTRRGNSKRTRKRYRKLVLPLEGVHSLPTSMKGMNREKGYTQFSRIFQILCNLASSSKFPLSQRYALITKHPHIPLTKSRNKTVAIPNWRGLTVKYVSFLFDSRV